MKYSQTKEVIPILVECSECGTKFDPAAEHRPHGRWLCPDCYTKMLDEMLQIKSTKKKTKQY